jgi:hypothetical protein
MAQRRCWCKDPSAAKQSAEKGQRPNSLLKNSNAPPLRLKALAKTQHLRYA